MKIIFSFDAKIRKNREITKYLTLKYLNAENDMNPNISVIQRLHFVMSLL